MALLYCVHPHSRDSLQGVRPPPALCISRDLSSFVVLTAYIRMTIIRDIPKGGIMTFLGNPDPTRIEGECSGFWGTFCTTNGLPYPTGNRQRGAGRAKSDDSADDLGAIYFMRGR